MGTMFRTLLLLLYATLATAGQASTIQCSNYCTESNVLSLEKGTTLEYLYSGWAESTLSAQSPRPEDHDASSGLLLNATVVVRTVSPCEISLELKDVEFSGESKGAAYADLLTKEPIRASLQAGRVETVCAVSANSAADRWALNVKKAILSAFQLPLKSFDSIEIVTFHEADVSGICRTSYQSMRTENSTLVTKSKDLTQCSGREGVIDLEPPKSGFRSASTPLLKGSQNCVQTIVDGKISFSHCKESHIFQPFSSNNGSNGATTTVHQILRLENITQDDSFIAPLPKEYSRTSLLFEFGEDEEIFTSEHQQEEAVEEARKSLHELVGESDQFSVRAESAKLFGNLIRALGKLDEQNLKTFVTEIELTDVERTYVMDALPSLDSPAGIALMSNLYMEREKQIGKIKVWLEENAASWFASLANAREVDSIPAKQLEKLLVYSLMGYAVESDVPSIVLGITGLARKMCEKTGSLDCNYRIYEVIVALEQVLKPEFNANEKTLIVAMKGLGNIGIFEQGEEPLKKIIQNETASIEIRLAAIDAFRRTPCSFLDSQFFLNLFADTTQDSEIRIAAYLVAVKCPSPAMLRVVKKSLYSETVNQVGSFVWTHLTNSQESTGKSRQMLRTLLANEYLQNKFNTDARQFSRNFEGSHYFESLKLGTNYDANVVFSTKSYLPRSAMLNLTVDLFGESINLLEIGGRAEGFEPLVEQLFSKRGVFENEAVENFLKNARKDPQYDSIRNLTAPMKKPSKPKASAFIRLQGHEISYLQLEDVLQNAYRFNIHPRDLLRNLFSRKEFEFTRSLDLANVKREIPTLLGIPLKLALNSTASVKFRARGHFEKNNGGLQVSGFLAPSASVALSGTMSMGEDDFEQGVRIEATLFTHTTLDSQFSISRDGKLNFQSHMPEEKQTLIDMKTERLIFHGNQVRKLPDLEHLQRENSSFCSGDWVDSLLGVKFCSDMSYPNNTLLEKGLAFPLNGDSHLVVTVEKTDPTFKAYEFAASWTHVPGSKYDYSIFYDRVGSELRNKKRAIVLAFDKEAGVALAGFDVPEKQAEISVLWDSKQFTAAELILSYDRVKYAEILAKFDHQKNTIANTKEQFGKIEPEVKFKVRGVPEFHLMGVINYSGKSKLTTELSLSGLTKKPIFVAADYYTDMSSGTMNARVSVDSQYISWDVKANAKVTPSSLGLRINGIYNSTVEDQHTLDIMTKYNWNQQGALKRGFLNLKTMFSQWPKYSGQMQADVMLSSGFYEGNLRLALTNEEWNVTQRYQTAGAADVWLKQTITCEKRGIDFFLEHRHKYVPDSFSTTTQLNVDPKRNANFHLDYKYIQGDGISFAAESKLIWPRFTFSTGEGPYLQSRVRQVLPGVFEAFLITQWMEDRKPVKIDATYKDRTTLQRLSHSLDLAVAGVCGFDDEKKLGLKGNFNAISNLANVDGIIVVGNSQKIAVDGKYEVDLTGTKSVAAKMSLWPTEETKKDYEIRGAYLKSPFESAASFDLIMSRHISFSFRTSDDIDRASFFWDKANDTSRNVTVTVEYPKHNEIAANLLLPGQNITVSGFTRLTSATSKYDESIFLSGHSIGGKVLWFPEREITLSSGYKGNFNLGLEAFAEIGTRNIPVIGSQVRSFEGEFVPPKVNDGGKLKLKHSWQNKQNKPDNIEAQFLIEKSNNELMLEFYLRSSLWEPRIVTGNFKNMFKNWNNFHGNVSGFCGQEGLSFAWEWNIKNGAKLEIDSSWEKIASTKLEVKYNSPVKSQPGVFWHWILFELGDETWKAALALKKEKSNESGDFVVEVALETPLADFKTHQIAAKLKWLKSDISCTGEILTPLVGASYSFDFSNQLNATLQKMQSKLRIMSEDETALEMEVISASIPIAQGLSAEIHLTLPDIMSVKSEVKVEIGKHGAQGKINFKNNDKLLHDFQIGYYHEDVAEKIEFEFDFSGLSYLVMSSRWKLKLQHEGTKLNHTSLLEVNKFILNHKFEFVGEEKWKLNVKGTADLKEVLKINLDHDGYMDCSHKAHLMGTDVFEIISKSELGFVNVNFLNSVLQINTRIVEDDEFKTTTKISANHKLYATVVTSTFLRYKENDGGLESAIISLNVDADGNNAKVQVNIDAWRQVTGSIRAKYEMHKLNLQLDVLSPNNSLQFSYQQNDETYAALDAFVFYGPPTAQLGLNLQVELYKLVVEGDGTMDDDMIVYATIKVEDNLYVDFFPLTVKGKWQLPKNENEIVTGGNITVKINTLGEVQLAAQANYEDFHKKLNVTAKMITKVDETYKEENYGVLAIYENRDKQYIFANYKQNSEKYEVEFMLTEMLMEAKLETPLENYEYLSLKAGVAELSKREKRFLEFIKNEYRLDAELFFTKQASKSQMIGIAKSNNGFEVEAVVDKIETERSTDVAIAVQLNDLSKIEAGAYLEFDIGNLNITTNLTRAGNTSRMRSVIYNTSQVKSFAIKSEFLDKTYELEIYSSIENEQAYEQGFKIETQGLKSEFRYEKSDNVSIAYLNYQEQSLQCELKGNSRLGTLSISHTNDKLISQIKIGFDFEKKADVGVFAFLNQPVVDNRENALPAHPLKINAILNPRDGNIHFSLKYKTTEYLVEGSFLEVDGKMKIHGAVNTPYFEKTSMNISYDFENTKKTIEIHFDYGSDFYEIVSEVFMDGSYSFNLNLDATSSVPDYEKIAVKGGFRNDEKFTGQIKMDIPSDSYVVSVESVPETRCSLKLETKESNYLINYAKQEDQWNYVEFFRGSQQIFNATFKMANETILTTIMTPHEKYNNLTLSVGYGSNLPSKNLIIHRNNDVVFKAHMYPMDQDEFNSGTGIMATIYQGDQKFVYDAQFSIDNPVFLILKQHDTGNVTRDILHFSLNVTDENTASGRAEILLPLSPNTKLLARGHVQIENKNAEFKMSYKFDEEEENNFSIHYTTYTDNYNIYNIVTNMTTPFKGYESLALRITSSWTETVVKFTSQFPNYENVALVAVHRLEGPKKELWVQYQNMQKSIFYVKAMFLNEDNNKRIEIKTRTPFLNGQALASNNGSVMEIMLEHESITLCQIVSKYEDDHNGRRYEFTFKKPERILHLESSFVKEIDMKFFFQAQLDTKQIAKIDFTIDPLGKIDSVLSLLDDVQYKMTGQLDWLAKSLKLTIWNESGFDAKIAFELQHQGFLQIMSSEMPHQIQIEWEFSDLITSFNITRGKIWDLNFAASNSHVSFKLANDGSVYSFMFGEVKNNGWPNVNLMIVWNNEAIIDFLHEFLTDAHLLIVKTRLTSPYLGSHKNMKFSLSLKTRGLVQMEAEFKWRPKDLTNFHATLQMERLVSTANVNFVSPFTSNFSFNAQYDFSATEKTFEIVYILGNTVSLQGRIIPTGIDQSLVVKLITPIAGYTSVELSGHHKLIGKTHRAELQFVRENERKSIEIFSDEKTLKATLNTPELRWSLNSNYLFSHDSHKIDGVFQWGGVSEVVKFDANYAPKKTVFINLTGPNDMKYLLDYKMTWTADQKSVELFIQKNMIVSELTGSLSTKENLHILVGSIKSPLFAFIQLSAVLDSASNELGGALQINEAAFSLKASKVVENSYKIHLLQDEVEQMDLTVAFEGEYETGLKILIDCKTQDYKFNAQGAVTLRDDNLQLSSTFSWGELDESLFISFKKQVNTEIECKLNTVMVPDSDIYVSFGQNFITTMLRNQSDTYKATANYLISETYSVNATLDVNGANYEVQTYCDPRDIQLHAIYLWPKDMRIDVKVILKPGDISLALKTPYVQFTNIQIHGKYSELMTYNDYQLASKADAKWNDYLISLSGIIKSSQNNYGLNGKLVWDNKNEIKLNFGVTDNRVLEFELNTPFKGLPHFSAHLEALKYRHIVSGIRGTLLTPFEKLPVLNFTFNRADDLIEMRFAFDTPTYKNISIHTKLRNKNNNYLYMQINTPFVSKVKHFVVDARSNKLVNKNGFDTKISVHLDDNIYEIHNNYTMVNGKLDSYVYMRGPSNRLNPIQVKFGGKFDMKSLNEMNVEAYLNDALLGFKYNLSKDVQLSGRVYLTSLIKLPKTEFALNLVRSNHFEGRFDYLYGDLEGNALVKNKLKNNSMETIMYLNLPQILKYPLQVELNANYQQPRLQFNGFASFMAEHRLELIMVQTSFRTTLNAQLTSAFFKGTNKFELTLSPGTLSVSMNDEIKITGLKKNNQLVLTLTQVSRGLDHTLTYNWDLSKPPTFEVTLESPILSSKKATFSATYLGPLKGVNIKLVSGSESLRLDYDVINKNNSKGLKIVMGNSQAQILNLAIYLDQITNGHEVIAELNVFEIDYKAAFKYSLPMQNANPNLDASLFLSLPYLFPIKLLSIDLKTSRHADRFTIASNISLDRDNLEIAGEMTNESLNVLVHSSYEMVQSLKLQAKYKEDGDQKSMVTELWINGDETLKANVTINRLPNGVILLVESKSKIKHFEEMTLRLTIPSELRYSLIATFELRGSSHFDAHLMLSSRPGYTNLELKLTGLAVNMYLTSNQGFFSYKTKFDDYSMKIYSKSSGHQLDSEVTVNSGQTELFKAGLFGMYHNNSDFYILMSTYCVYEGMPDAVFYIGAKKSEIKFGTEFDYKQGEKVSYSVIINHFIESATDFDIGIVLENSDMEIFITKLTHILKEDFYIALAQVNRDIIKISKIERTPVTLVTGTVKCGGFSTEISGKLSNEITSKAVELKLTWHGELYQAGGSYNYTEDEYINVKFNLNSPQTGQNNGVFEFRKPTILYILFDRNQSPVLLIELDAEKVRSKYVLLNTTETKFMLSEFYNNQSYELVASALYSEQNYQFQFDSDSFPESPNSFRSNTTITFPTRTVGLNMEKYLSDSHNVSQFYVSWEKLDRRIGYTIDVTKDNFKTNLKTSIEIPNRAIDFKTHYKLMVIPEEVTDFEFGVQFSWNSKIRLNPITFITTVKLDHEQKMAYHYTVLAHPSFNSSYVIDGKMNKLDPYDNFFTVKMGPVEDGKMTPSLTLKMNMTRKSASSQYHLTVEHPRSNLHQQWEVQLNYENGLGATVSMLQGAKMGYSQVSFSYNNQKSKIQLGLVHNDLTAEVEGQLIIDRPSKKYGIFSSGAFDATVPPMTLLMVFEKPESSFWLINADLNLAPNRAYFAEAKFTPHHISALMATHEYGKIQPAVQAALTLNTSDTISFVGKYQAPIWKNLTHDLSHPAERAKFVTVEILKGLKSIISEEIFAKIVGIVKSSAARSTYQKIVEHTTSEWNSVRQDVASFKQLIMQIYQKDAFYLKTIWDYAIKAFSYGQKLTNDGLAKAYEALKTLFTKTIPSLFTTIYINTIEPLVSAFQKFSPTLTKFVRKIMSTWNEIQVGVSSAFRTSLSYTQEGAMRITKHTQENLVSVTNWVNETKSWLMTDYVEPGRKSVTEMANALENFLKEINEYFVALPNEIKAYCLELEEVQEAIKIYKRFYAWFEEFRFAQYVIEIQNKLQSWYEKLLEDLRECIGEHAHIVPKIINAIKGSYDELMAMPSVVYARIMYEKVQIKLVYLWDSWKMEKVVQEFLIRLSDQIIMLVQQISKSSVDYREKILVSEERWSFNYDPQNGEIAGSMKLPLTWKRFDQMPTLAEDLSEKYHNFRYSILDQVYEMTGISNVNWKDAVWRTLMPPFRSNSLVTVNGHIITFDGNHYKVKNGLCGSYLFAADYVDHSFALVATFGNELNRVSGQLTSMTLYSQSGNKVSITLGQPPSRSDVDGQSKVFLNGTKVELPLRMDAFEITRQGPRVIAENEEQGIGLHCNIITGLCSLDLSGWYHGKVAGIAGSLDKEQRNDFAHPNGRVVDSTVVEFLEQWKVSSPGLCEVPTKPRPRQRDFERSMCTKLFSKLESSLEPCFSRLDPAPFKEMCEQEIDGTTSDKGPDCLAAEAYLEQCKFVGIELSLPSHCSRCRLPSGKNIQAGDVMIYDSSPKSRSPPPPQIADFVFLVESGSEKNCLQGKHLTDLPAKIDSVLRATQGINSTKFSLLTFRAGKPFFIHTLDGNIWSGRKGIQNALSNLKMETSEETANNHDLYKALLAASSKLHFRPGASKNLILAPCTSCDRTEDTTTVFSEASSLLMEADIRLHVLQRDEMIFKRTITNKKTKQGKVSPVMGFDSHGAYTGRRIKGTSWPLASKAIMRQLSIPKDLCTPLALETNGTLFSAAKLSSRGASDDKRKWLDVWSRRVATSAKPTSCQTCDCLPLPDGSSKLMCHPCISPAIASYLDEWERALEESMQEEMEEDYGSIEVPDLDAEVGDFETEMEAINRVRSSIYPGNAFTTDSV